MFKITIIKLDCVFNRTLNTWLEFSESDKVKLRDLNYNSKIYLRNNLAGGATQSDSNGPVRIISWRGPYRNNICILDSIPSGTKCYVFIFTSTRYYCRALF